MIGKAFFNFMFLINFFLQFCLESNKFQFPSYIKLIKDSFANILSLKKQVLGFPSSNLFTGRDLSYKQHKVESLVSF